MDSTALETTLDPEALDRAVAELADHAGSWTATSLPERTRLLERLLPRIWEAAETLVASSAEAKGYTLDSSWIAEDWIGGAWALAQNTSALLHVLRRIEAGKDPVPAKAMRDREGRTVVEVFPATVWDRLLLNGFRAEVWASPGVTPAEVRDRAAGPYRGQPADPGVALVLGAGNVASITALDILHKLYVEGQVVVAKLNPVNAYLRPAFEAIFAEYVEHGWLRFVDGGATEGAYLTRHDGIDTVHVTGSRLTHDAIVWGRDDHAEQRRRDGAPLLTKPFTSELGGISPFIVVPGRWSEADFRFQAEHIVTSKLNNSGHNCIASQILLLPQDWDGTERLLACIRTVLRQLPPRHDYYPGADQRLGVVLAAHPDAETYGEGPCRVLVPHVTAEDDVLITEEIFASALGVIRLPGATAAEFLPRAVELANDKLPGTLGATLVVHPRATKNDRAAVDRAITDLRYGTVGVNCWAGVGFLLGYTPWGAYPGQTVHDIGSGVGFVHNAFMLEDIEKTILRAPFAPLPRGLVSGAASLSPKPPYFVTNNSALTTIRRLTRFTTAPSITRLPGIFASAIRG